MTSEVDQNALDARKAAQEAKTALAEARVVLKCVQEDRAALESMVKSLRKDTEEWRTFTIRAEALRNAVDLSKFVKAEDRDVLAEADQYEEWLSESINEEAPPMTFEVVAKSVVGANSATVANPESFLEKATRLVEDLPAEHWRYSVEVDGSLVTGIVPKEDRVHLARMVLMKATAMDLLP